MSKTLQCPYCKQPMRLTSGNIIYSYWVCKNCKKEFEFNIFTEEFTDEEEIKDNIYE